MARECDVPLIVFTESLVDCKGLLILLIGHRSRMGGVGVFPRGEEREEHMRRRRTMAPLAK